MPAITLPDGSIRSFEAAVTGTQIAEAIGPGLARAALAMVVDGQEMDMSRQARMPRSNSSPARIGAGADPP